MKRHARHTRFLIPFCLILLGSGLVASPLWVAAQSQDRGGRPVIDIDPKAGRPKLTIVVTGFPEFRLPDGREDAGKFGHDVLRADLAASAIFDPLDPAVLPMDPRTVQPGQERTLYPGLNALKVQYLVIAGLALRGRDLVLDGRLFDVGAGQEIIGKNYVGDPKVLRTMIHRFADEIVYQVTGERGIASTRIAHVQDVGGGAKEIFLMDYDGFNPVLITGNRSINLSPRWSPDGSRITYTSYRNNNPDLFVLDLRSGRRTPISNTPGLNAAAAWSPDGEWLALSKSAGGTNLFLMRPDGSGQRQVTFGSGIAISASFSPNGKQIAFTSDQGGSPQIYVMDVTGSNLQRLTFRGTYNVSPRWSPRGDKIAYVAREGGSMDIWLMDPNGNNQQRLTDGVGQNEEPSWAPGGRHVAFTSNRDGRRNIYRIVADGTGLTRLTSNGRENYLADWSP
jgi:TolB protein